MKATIYIVGMKTSRLIKIGRTCATVERRIYQWQVGNPCLLAPVFTVTVEGSLAEINTLESGIHGLLLEHHHRGEWFRISQWGAIDTIHRLLLRGGHRFREARGYTPTAKMAVRKHFTTNKETDDDE